MKISKDTKELLIEIKKRPGMYLGKKSLTLLQAFYNDYSHARKKFTSNDKEFDDFFVSLTVGLQINSVLNHHIAALL